MKVLPALLFSIRGEKYDNQHRKSADQKSDPASEEEQAASGTGNLYYRRNQNVPGSTARISSQEKRRSGVLYSYIPFISSSILRFMLSPFLCVNLTHDRLFLPNAIQIVSHSVLSGLTSVYSNIFFNSSIQVLTSLNSR